MKFAPLAAILSLAAAPVNAQENPLPQSGQSDALLMPCPDEDTLDQCVETAKKISKDMDTAVLAIKTSPSGEPALRFILRDLVIPVDPKDIEVEMYVVPEDETAPAPVARPAPPQPTA